MWIEFLHIAAVFIAVALTAGVGIHTMQIVKSCDVRAIRVAVHAAIPLSIAGGIVLIVGALLGLVVAVQLGYSLTAPWLVVTYILLALLILDGFLDKLPWMRAVESAARLSADDNASDELRRLSNRKVDTIAGPIGGLFWLVILVMMVVKP
jgi:hypothetical protein